ncbi:hypothetical protein [Desulfobacula sp.]
MNILRLFHTVRYLKPVQVYGRLWFKLNRPGLDLSLPAETRPITGNWSKPCKKTPSLLSPFTFNFLNESHEIKSLSDWNNLKWEKLWLYNLHYFDDLQSRDAESKK